MNSTPKISKKPEQGGSGMLWKAVLISLFMLSNAVSILGQQDRNDEPEVRHDLFGKTVSLPRQYSSVYSLLNQISGQIGYYFVYETELLDSDRRIRLRAGNRSLGSWLEEIVGDTELDYKIIENHILIHNPIRPDSQLETTTSKDDYVVIKGRILDESSRTPLPYATVSLSGRSVGITANSDGVFTLRVPERYMDELVAISHIGYKSQRLPMGIFIDSRVDILMETEYISIQEVMIRYFDPVEIVRTAIDRKNENYSNEPVYLLNFYREGVMRGNRFVNYSEAFFQIYKSSYNRIYEQDQVRLLQSRTISNLDQSDTLILKIRAGIRSSLELDFIKNVPDFLNPVYFEEYDYTKADIISVDGSQAYAIAFEQKDHITEPLYKGILYIDMESHAFLGADFEVHPRYIDKANHQFLARRNRQYRASVERAGYTVSYRYYNGRFHLNHVRADLNISYRRRFQIFSNNYHVFVEMVTSRIESENVERFSRRDALQTGHVFMDGNHAYDPSFWMGHSIIEPEKRITDALSRIDSKIESVIPEK
jgi:hypothetical protein